MSEEQSNNVEQDPNLTNEPTSPVDEVDDVLTNDLTDTSAKEPLIPLNDYDLEVVKLENIKSEKTGSKGISIQLKHINPVTATNGEVLVNKQEFARIWTTPTDKMSTEQIKRNLKRFQVACGIKSGPFMPFDQYVGKIVKAKIGFSKKSPEYPEDRNEVKSFVVN